MLAVESCGVESLRVGVAVSPFAVVEGVESEVYEGVCLHLLPVNLLLFGHRQDWGGSLHVLLSRRIHTQYGCACQHG